MPALKQDHATLDELIAAHQGRLRPLQIQAARQGNDTPPHVLTEIEQIESEIAEHVARRLLARDGDAQAELLEGRLATLRMCVRELAGVTL